MAAQPPDPLGWTGKLHWHAAGAYAPISLIGFGAYAAVQQGLDAPTEWGEGGAAFGKRFASTAGRAAIHSTLAFGLDATLHQDPRYFESHASGFWRRAGYAVRGTILTRTDAGGQTFSTWRVGSDYGAAFLSNLWYPARPDNVRRGFIQGSASLGADALKNLGIEFWPDIKKIVFRKK
jgi:hypothetical protein